MPFARVCGKMRWQFGGNLQPVRIICEFDWRECPSAIINYIWSEIVTDVVDCLTNEWLLWRVIAMLFVCTLLVHTIYSKTRLMEETSVNRDSLNIVGCKVQDLELKVNILTYKMQYGTWPLPRQIRSTGIEGGLRNVRLTLTNSQDRNAWLKHMLLSPSENAEFVPYAKFGPRSVRCLTKLINLETKYMASRFSGDASPASNKTKSSSSEKSMRYERISQKSSDSVDDRGDEKYIPKSENLGMRRKDSPRSSRKETSCWSETQVLKYRKHPRLQSRNENQTFEDPIDGTKIEQIFTSSEERENSIQTLNCHPKNPSKKFSTGAKEVDGFTTKSEDFANSDQPLKHQKHPRLQSKNENQTSEDSIDGKKIEQILTSPDERENLIRSLNYHPKSPSKKLSTGARNIDDFTTKSEELADFDQPLKYRKYSRSNSRNENQTSEDSTGGKKIEQIFTSPEERENPIQTLNHHPKNPSKKLSTGVAKINEFRTKSEELGDCDQPLKYRRHSRSRSRNEDQTFEESTGGKKIEQIFTSPEERENPMQTLNHHPKNPSKKLSTGVAKINEFRTKSEELGDCDQPLKYRRHSRSRSRNEDQTFEESTGGKKIEQIFTSPEERENPIQTLNHHPKNPSKKLSTSVPKINEFRTKSEELGDSDKPQNYRERPKSSSRPQRHESAKKLSASGRKSEEIGKSPEERVNTTNETLHQVKEKLESLHSVLRIYGSPDSATKTQEVASRKELAESILQDLKNLGDFPTESESDGRTSGCVPALLDSNPEESQCPGEATDSTSEFEQCRSERDSSSARSDSNPFERGGDLRVGEKTDSKDFFKERNEEKIVEKKFQDGRSKIDRESIDRSKDFSDNARNEEILFEKKFQFERTKIDREAKNSPEGKEFLGTKNGPIESSDEETKKCVPRVIEYAARSSPSSSQTELSKDSDADDKSNATLLREALKFKKALLTQIELENEEKNIEIDDSREGKIEDSDVDSDEPHWPKAKNYFQSKLLDIISEEQSASSSTEKTSKTFALARQEKRAEDSSGRRAIEDLTKNSSKLPLVSESSEYFSLSNLEEKLAAQRTVSVTRRETLDSSDFTEDEPDEPDEGDLKRNISELVDQSVKNIRDYIEVFSQIQSDAIVETRRAIIDDEPSTVETRRATFDDESAIVETRRAMFDDESAVVETRQALFDDESAIVETRQAMFDDESAIVETRRAMFDDESAIVSTRRATVETGRATFDDDPPIVSPGLKDCSSEDSIMHFVNTVAMSDSVCEQLPRKLSEPLLNGLLESETTESDEEGFSDFSLKRRPGSISLAEHDNGKSSDRREARRLLESADDDDRPDALSSEPSCKELVMDYSVESDGDLTDEKLSATLNLIVFEEEESRSRDEKTRTDSPLTGRTVVRAASSVRNFRTESTGQSDFNGDAEKDRLVEEFAISEVNREISEANLPETSSVYFTDDVSVYDKKIDEEDVEESVDNVSESSTWILENPERRSKTEGEEIEAGDSAISEGPCESAEFVKTTEKNIEELEKNRETMEKNVLKELEERPFLGETVEKNVIEELEKRPFLGETVEKNIIEELEKRQFLGETVEKNIMEELEKRPFLVETVEKNIIEKLEERPFSGETIVRKEIDGEEEVPSRANLSSETSGTYMDASSRDYLNSSGTSLVFEKSVLDPSPKRIEISAASKSARGSSSSPLQQRVPWNTPRRGSSLNNASSRVKRLDEPNSKVDKSKEISSIDKSNKISSTDKSNKISSTDKSNKISSADKSNKISSTDKSNKISSTDKSKETSPTDKSKETSSVDKSNKISSTDKSTKKSKPTRSQSPSSKEIKPKSDLSLSGTKDLESSITTPGRCSSKSGSELPERRSRSYATPRKSEASPRNSTTSQSTENPRPSRTRRDPTKPSLESAKSESLSGALSSKASSKSCLAKTSSKSCIPILRSRLENARQTRAKSPMRGPLTMSMSWSQEARRTISDPPATIPSEGSPQLGRDETSEASPLQEPCLLEEIERRKQQSRSTGKLPESRTVIYVNIVTEQEHSATRVVDPKKFLEYLKDRDLKIQGVLDQELGVESMAEEIAGCGSPRILTVVSSAVGGEVPSDGSLPAGSDNSALTGSWSLRVEQREIEVSAKPSVIDTSTSISDLLPEISTERANGCPGKFKIFEVPKELTKDEYIVLLEALNQDPNLQQLREMHKLCNKLGLGFHE